MHQSATKPEMTACIPPKSHQVTGDQPDLLHRIVDLLQEAARRGDPAMCTRLDACLLDERLASADSAAWVQLRNPFPELRMAEESA